MNVFVTGATGFVGSHLVDRLLERGDTVYCLVRGSSNLRWLGGKSVRLVYGDLEAGPGGDLAEALEKAEVVYHVAGAISAFTREDFLKINAGGTQKLLEALAKTKPPLRRFLLVSSISASGPGVGDSPIVETQEPRPMTWYGESKLEADKAALRFQDRFPVTIVRPPPVYGPRDASMLDIMKAINIGVIPTWGRGVRTNFLYVSDLVTGIVLAVESPKSPGQAYNIADAENLPADAALKRMAGAAGKRTVTLKIPLSLLYGAAALSELRGRLTRTPAVFSWQKMNELKETNWTVDITKARRDLGYEPEVRLEKGGRTTFDWYREKGWI
jgi:dihydroflavonol-4-reductase